MRWLEVIKVRALHHSVGIAMSHLNDAKERLAGKPGLESVEVYAGLTSPFDVAIHLVWKKGDCVVDGESEAGRQIAVELAKFGLVDHFIWRLRNVWNTPADEHEAAAAEALQPEART